MSNTNGKSGKTEYRDGGTRVVTITPPAKPPKK